MFRSSDEVRLPGGKLGIMKQRVEHKFGDTSMGKSESMRLYIKIVRERMETSRITIVVCQRWARSRRRLTCC